MNLYPSFHSYQYLSLCCGNLRMTSNSAESFTHWCDVTQALSFTLRGSEGSRDSRLKAALRTRGSLTYRTCGWFGHTHHSLQLHFAHLEWHCLAGTVLLFEASSFWAWLYNSLTTTRIAGSPRSLGCGAARCLFHMFLAATRANLPLLLASSIRVITTIYLHPNVIPIDDVSGRALFQR